MYAVYITNSASHLKITVTTSDKSTTPNCLNNKLYSNSGFHVLYLCAKKKCHNSLNERPKYACTKVTIVTSKKVFLYRVFLLQQSSYSYSQQRFNLTNIYIHKLNRS